MTDLLWVLPAALLVAAAAAEIVARWWLRRRRGYYVFPPFMRLRLRPDREAFPQLEPEIRFDINSDGERGSEVPRETDGLYRVLVAGGSQPEGYLLDQDSSWPGALHRLLERPDRRQRLGASRVHVGNIAKSGVGSEALDLILERVLPRYSRLQAIVILVGVSDVSRWIEYRSPAFPPPPVRTVDVFGVHPEGSFAWKPGGLALVELTRRARYRWLQSPQVHDHAGRWLGRARQMRARAKNILHTMPDPTPMLDHFETHLRRAVSRAKAHADRVIVVRQPWFEKDYTAEEAAHMWHGGLGQAWREELDTYYSFDVFFKLLSLLDERAATVSKALEVEQVDLMPVLERSLRTYYDCFHLTPAGAQSVAATVADAIVLRTSTRALDEGRRVQAAGRRPQPAVHRPNAGGWAALRRVQ